MSDEEYFEQLCSNSIDGTLTDAERQKLEAHLAECASCAALQQDLMWMQSAFSAEAKLPEGLHEGIMQRLEQESRLRVIQPEKPVRRMPAITMVVAAAVVVLAVLGGGWMPQFFSTVGTGAVSAATAETTAPTAADMSRAAAGGDIQGAERSIEQGDTSSPNAGVSSGAPEAQRPSESGAQEDVAIELEPKTAQQNTSVIEMPESMRAITVAHCYLAQGGGELPDIGGELLGTDGDNSWFLLENSLSAIQDTLGAIEQAGYTVSAYEGAGITIDSKATSWMLIVSAD